MMKKSRKTVFAAVLAISLMVILPFLIPMQTYLHQVEKIASDNLGQPVAIGEAHLQLLPSPRVSASDITVGAHDELKVARLEVVPTLTSLFSDTKIVDLSINKVVIKQAAIEGLVAALKMSGNNPSSVSIRHIKMNGIALVLPDKNLPILNAEVLLSVGNRLQSATVKTTDGKLIADITPNDDEQLIMLKASKLTLPAGLPLLIDRAAVQMHLKGSRLTIPRIDVALYGGKLKGDAVLSWAELKGKKNWKLTGSFNVDQLSTLEPSRLVSQSVYLSGSLFCKGNFSSTSMVAGMLVDHLKTKVQFKVNNGVLHNLDLVRVASLLLKQNQGGGETQFDAFSGVLSTFGKQYQLRDLNVSSGLLLAAGQVKVSQNKALDGVLEVEVKSGISMAAIPLNVSGTVNHPVLLPTKAALAGAVAGTAILGPGVGTSLGIKAAGAVDKLKGWFGGQ